jgi:hypothetical protein
MSLDISFTPAHQETPKSFDRPEPIAYPGYLSVTVGRVAEEDTEKLAAIQAEIEKAQEQTRKQLQALQTKLAGCPEAQELKRLRTRLEQAQKDEAEAQEIRQKAHRAAIDAIRAGKDHTAFDRESEAAVPREQLALRTRTALAPAVQDAEQAYKTVVSTRLEEFRTEGVQAADVREKELMAELDRAIVDAAGRIEAVRQLRTLLQGSALIPKSPPVLLGQPEAA